MKIKEWLKNKLLTFLNVEGIINTKIKEELFTTKDRLNQSNLKYLEAIKEVKDAKKMVNSIIQVGVDVHPQNPSENWAVICIGGNKDYVRFIPMKQNNVQDISRFLRRFEERGVKMDTPYAYMKEDMFVGW